MREAGGLGTQWAADIAKQVQSQSGEFAKRASVLVEAFSKAAPGGSEAASAAMRSVFAAANSAYDSWNRFSKQATEMAAANIGAVTEAVKKSKEPKAA